MPLTGSLSRKKAQDNLMEVMFVLDYNTYATNFFDVALKASTYVDIIWLRIKGIDASLVLSLSAKLRALLPDTTLYLSERADIADICKFDGVHLGADSVPVDAVKRNFKSLKVGYSAHSIDEITRLNADYFTLSPIFPTKKNYEVRPLGPVNVSQLGKNVFALGGINVKNIKELKGLGFKGVAGISFLEDLPHIKYLLDATK